MSIELVLVPIVIAAASAMKAGSKSMNGSIYCLNTRMKNGLMLEKALQNYGCPVFTAENQIHSSLQDTRVVFQPNEAGVFQAEFHQVVPQEAAQQLVDEIYDEYTKVVQEQVYNNLLAKAKNQGFALVSETVENDNSVVLTFDIQEVENVKAG